jgi:hypothetical protein
MRDRLVDRGHPAHGGQLSKVRADLLVSYWFGAGPFDNEALPEDGWRQISHG